MPVTLKELAESLETDWCGDPELLLERVSPFETAGAGSLALAAGPRRERLAESRASAFIVAADSVTDADRARFSLLLADIPKVVFARAVARLHVKPYRAEGVASDFSPGEGTTLGDAVTVKPRVTVGRNCRIGARTTLSPGVVIGDGVIVGDDCVLHPNVTIYDRAIIGNRVVIHAGSVVGSDGFGFAQDAEGRHVKIPQVGDVVIEDDVELGANCAIDRATLGTTRVGRGTKFDNMVHVAHNCDIGEETLIAAQVGLSGSVKVGRRVVIAGQVGTNPQVEIGDGAVIAGKSGVSKSVPPGTQASGMPIQTLKDWKLTHIFSAQLPKRLPKLEARVTALEERVQGSGAKETMNDE